MPASGLVSVIATSYNQRRTLELLFASLERQSVRGFEVIVADDGSSDGSVELCRAWPGLEIRFVTQADEGYRKSRILNEAIHASRGDYLVFVDSDVVLERHFLEDHLALRMPGSFVCGRRVDLGPVISETVTVGQVRAGFFDRLSVALIKSALGKDTIGWKRAIRLRSRTLRKALGYDRPIDILGSNFSLWKNDLLEVNGFNEAMEAYWGEDGDLFVRLRNSEKKSIGAKGLCVQFHVFHQRREASREHIGQIEALLGVTDYRRAVKGYDSRFRR